MRLTRRISKVHQKGVTFVSHILAQHIEKSIEHLTIRSETLGFIARPQDVELTCSNFITVGRQRPCVSEAPIPTKELGRVEFEFLAGEVNAIAGHPFCRWRTKEDGSRSRIVAVSFPILFRTCRVAVMLLFPRSDAPYLESTFVFLERRQQGASPGCL